MFNRFLLILVVVLSAPLAGANALKHHPSPYLALHGDDPVDWHPWGAEALEKARKENKLVFVSVGYFSCHWCHVMQRESFSDKDIAAVLNRHYVSIKVDRELNPALDGRLMAFVQATTGRGGWPMNVFLTPDGYPIAGLTYAPPARFMRIVEDLQQRWQTSRDELEAAARDVDAVLAERRAAENRVLEGEQSLQQWKQPLLKALMRVADTMKGGFGDQAKFPSVPQLWALLTLGEGDEIAEFLQLTLDTMASHGLHDAVGGGFFRYTVDPDWETPHYEKMLYTNAMLAMLYARAAKRFDNPYYHEIARDTLRFMDREMRAPGGAYIASLSAVDENNVEGGYYLWSQKQLREQLTAEEMDLVNVGWAMDRYEDGDTEVLPWQVVDLDTLAQQFGQSRETLARKMATIRHKLQQARKATRGLPRDDKRLAAWNGMALVALSEVASDKVPRAHGARLKAFIEKVLWQDGMLLRAVDGKGRSMGAGGLADYAWTALGMLRWSAATNDRSAAQLGHQLVHAAWQRFHTPQGWRETEQTLLPMPLYQRHLPDGAIPSAEAILLRATRLSLRAKPDKALQKQLDRILVTPTQQLEDGLYWYGSLIAAAFADGQE